MSRRLNERGQVLVVTAMAVSALIGMGGLAVDVGAWFRAQRGLQATADAAALAGAQELPESTADAQNTAVSYGTTNGGGVVAADVTFPSSDTISVIAKKQHPGFLTRVFGVNLVDVDARSAARVGVPSEARYVAPMVVSCEHPLIDDCDGSKTPVFNQETTLDFDKMGAPGAFGMLDLSNSNGNVGSSTLGDWIQHGYDDYLPLGKYDSDPGAKFSSGDVSDALTGRVGSVLLFPVFDTLTDNGSNAQYNIIGWIGFHLDEVVSIHGNNATLRGYFTTYIAQGLLASTFNGSTNLGVKSIQLIQ